MRDRQVTTILSKLAKLLPEYLLYTNAIGNLIWSFRKDKLMQKSLRFSCAQNRVHYLGILELPNLPAL